MDQFSDKMMQENYYYDQTQPQNYQTQPQNYQNQAQNYLNQPQNYPKQNYQNYLDYGYNNYDNAGSAFYPNPAKCQSYFDFGITPVTGVMIFAAAALSFYTIYKTFLSLDDAGREINQTLDLVWNGKP